MRKLFAITLMTAVVLAWWYAHDVSTIASGQAKLDCTIGSGRADLNDDGKADISDASYLLSWLFLGGPEPVACAAPPSEDEFAKNIAGTFIVCGRNREGVVTSHSLSTINADGTGHTANDYQFTSVPDALARYTSVMKSSWKKLDDQTSLHIIMQFYFDEEGEITYIMRMSTTITWAGDFNRYSGPWAAEFFPPGAINCDPAGGPQLDFDNPEFVVLGTLSGVRVPVN